MKFVFTELSDDTYFILADKAIFEFLKLGQNDKINNAELIKENYVANLIFAYTPKPKLDKAEDIWNYIYPNEIYIGWEDEDIYLSVSCECDWEQEHGLQLIFKNGKKLTRVSYHDGQFEDD